MDASERTSCQSDAVTPPSVPVPIWPGDRVPIPTPEDTTAFRQWFALKARNNELIAETKALMALVEQARKELQGEEERLKQKVGRSTKPKRQRRTADQIERTHICPNCSKSYGSEGSLIQHMKLKHEPSDDKDDDSISS